MPLSGFTTVLAAIGFAALLAGVVAAWLWGPAWLAAWRRRRVIQEPFPAEWRDILRRRMPAFARLPTDVQLQLKKLAQVLLAEKPFVGCAGLTVTDEMRVLVSVQACLLLLRLGPDGFAELRLVLIYPGPFVVDRSQPDASGLVHEQRRALSGESWQQGQVILSWADVLAGAADPADGHNVVLHEFAHQIDQAHGRANGAPWLPTRSGRQRWAQVMNAEFENLRRQLATGEPHLIDAYGATEPAEFFAVVCELFFEKPLEMAERHPALFTELLGLFRVDPRHWQGTTVYRPG
jgi:Mlc titration factor MtfA (ptsG expression regulator)